MFWTIFFMLLVGHAIMDYTLQSDSMAVNKNRKLNDNKSVPWYYWMAAHSLQHGGMVTILTGSVWLGLAETLLHAVADIAKCEGWTNIHVDQALHVASKAAWAGIIVSFIP